MTKYLVKKECITPIGTFIEPGDEITGEFSNSYIDRGFIEEIKEDSRWRAEIRAEYFYVKTSGSRGVHVNNIKEDHDSFDNTLHGNGNYFKSERTATIVAEALKLFFEWLHDQDGEEIRAIADGSLLELYRASNEARNAVLADDKRGSDE